jgi:hypothetical protein
MRWFDDFENWLQSCLSLYLAGRTGERLERRKICATAVPEVHVSPIVAILGAKHQANPQNDIKWTSLFITYGVQS